MGSKQSVQQNSSYSAMNSNCDGGNSVVNYDPRTAMARRIAPKTVEKDKEVAALILTISSSSSYDHLYQEVEQKSPDPDQYVSVFELNFEVLPHFILKFLNYHPELATNGNDEEFTTYLQNIINPAKDETKILPTDVSNLITEIMTEMATLDPENIVINWECCGGCSASGFPLNMKVPFILTKAAIDRKLTVIFSDFSLMALIAKWNKDEAKYLGPNPFEQVGTFSNSFTLRFNPDTLAACSFSQLENVGELCEQGAATVGAMGGTILYTLPSLTGDAKRKQENIPYTAEVLTVVSSAKSPSVWPKESMITIKMKDETEISGLAGHVVLKYHNGGKILTNTGHWIELVKLDASMESALRHAEKKYGAEYANNLKSNWDNYSYEDQVEQVRLYSNCEVQKSAPCNYKKSMFK